MALAALASPAATEEFRATIAAGHPPVFRWVRSIPEVFMPEVEAGLEGTGQAMTFEEQYGGAVAGVGEGLGLAEIGVVQSLFDPSELAVQNVT